MELYHETEYVKISYKQSFDYINLEWLTPPANADFKSGCEQMLMAIMHYGATKVLIDARQQGIIHQKMTEWMRRVLLKRLVVQGCGHCAIIIPTDIFASFFLVEVSQMSDKSLAITEYFEEEKIAIDWLKKLSVSEVTRTS